MPLFVTCYNTRQLNSANSYVKHCQSRNILEQMKSHASAQFVTASLGVWTHKKKHTHNNNTKSRKCPIIIRIHHRFTLKMNEHNARRKKIVQIPMWKNGQFNIFLHVIPFHSAHFEFDRLWISWIDENPNTKSVCFIFHHISCSLYIWTSESNAKSFDFVKSPRRTEQQKKATTPKSKNYP